MTNDIAVVVTGASGWLGKGLIYSLLNGIEELTSLPDLVGSRKIRALVMPGERSSLENYYDRGRVELIEGDIRYKADCEALLDGCEGAILIHTAGIIHPNKVADFIDINVNGTMNLLRTAEKFALKRAVVVSSNSPIGTNPCHDHVFDEESPFNPYMGYGKSKMLMEQAIIKLQEQGNLETVRIRAPWFYGPHQPDRQSLFFEMIRDGKGPIVGNGENRRSMAYIENLSQGLILAANAQIANGKVYWIADEKPYSMNEIIDTIESVLETGFGIPCAHKRMKLPSFASDVAWLVDKTFQSVGIYHQKIHVLSEMNKTIACSVSLAKQELGYTPTVSLREGMTRSIRWMYENGQPLS